MGSERHLGDAVTLDTFVIEATDTAWQMYGRESEIHNIKILYSARVFCVGISSVAKMFTMVILT